MRLLETHSTTIPNANPRPFDLARNYFDVFIVPAHKLSEFSPNSHRPVLTTLLSIAIDVVT
jgi:hypothetical protein